MSTKAAPHALAADSIMRPCSPEPMTSLSLPAASPSRGGSPPSKRSFCIEALLANNEGGRKLDDAMEVEELRQRRGAPLGYGDVYGRYYHHNNNIKKAASSSPASDLSLPRATSVDSPPASPQVSPPASPASRGASERSEDSMSPPISPGSEDPPENYGGRRSPKRDQFFAGPGSNGFLALNRSLGLPPLPRGVEGPGGRPGGLLGHGAMFSGGHPLAGPPHPLAGHHALYYPGHAPQGHHPGLGPGSAFHPAGKGPGAMPPGPGGHPGGPQHQMNLQHMQLEWLSRTGMFYPRLPDLSGEYFAHMLVATVATFYTLTAHAAADVPSA